MGRVLFSDHGSGFGFWDLARVGSRVNDFWARVSKIWFGSNSGQVFFSFFSQFWPNSWMVEQCMQKSLAKWWSSTCQITIRLEKIIPWVARVLKIIVWVGLGWPKRPRVGFWPNLSLANAIPIEPLKPILELVFEPPKKRTKQNLVIPKYVPCVNLQSWNSNLTWF